jgi:hypothetical protein
MISIIVNGTETQITSIGNLRAHDGWGMSPLHNITERGPMQHGDTFRDFRLDPRTARFKFKMALTDLGDMYDQRQAILAYFPVMEWIQVRWELPYGTRQFDCRYESDLSLPWEVQQWAAQDFVLALTAHDPTCYDPVGEGVTFDLGGGSDSGMIVPTVVPYYIGTSVLDVYKTVNYPGTWHSFPHKIRITGPITGAIVTNVTTGDKLDFSGITIAVGNYYDVDLRYGYKTVVDSAGADRVAELSDDSDLSTWHLRAATSVPGTGITSASNPNSIRVQGTAIDSSTQVGISYYVRYIGI